MVDSVMLSSKSAEFGTPDAFLAAIAKISGPFHTDPCAARREFAKAPRFYAPIVDQYGNPIPLAEGAAGGDGLVQPWIDNTFGNFPWRRADKKKGVVGIRIQDWVAKAIREYRLPHCRSVTALIPARTDTKWFLDMYKHASIVAFVHGRLSFATLDVAAGTSTMTDPAMFPSVVFVLDRSIKTQTVGIISADGELLV